MRATVFPINDVHFRPAFWGVERDLSDVVNRIESIWGEKASMPSITFADLQETEKAFLVTIDMPGVNKSDLSLEIEEDRILVNGVRKKSLVADTEENQKVFRIVTLPQNVDKDKVQAHLEDGVLYVAMPKLEKEKPKRIELTEGVKSGLWTKFLGDKGKLQN
jgi:HSP20 family protein